MKANSKAAHKEAWVDALYETLEDNVLVTVLVLHESFGFGKKRLGRYLTAFEEMAERLNTMVEDDIKGYKTSDYRAKYKQDIKDILSHSSKHLMPDEFYDKVFVKGHNTKREVETEAARAMRKKHENPLSLSESAELQAKMQAFGDFLKDKERCR